MARVGIGVVVVVVAVAVVSGDGEAVVMAVVEDEDGMPRISASAAELDAAMRLAAMMRARWARGLFVG